MAQADGMRAGTFAQATDHSSLYLVASLWDNLQSHQTYLATHFPHPHTLQSIQGYILQLEPTSPPSKSKTTTTAPINS